MNLEHSFTVPTGIDEAWKILLDIERIGPCMPGASIESVDGDDFTGSVKVKLGPIGLTYKGKASFIEKDEAAHRAVIDARGRDARGNGTASAKVTAVLSDEDGSSTLVKVNTDLDITGKPAQFGRGVMVDVGNKLIGQFADSLSAEISSGSTTPADAAPAADPPADAPAAKSPARKRTPKPAPVTTSEPTAAAATPDVTDDAGPAEAPAVKPAAAEANGRQVKPSRPVREVEPINLLESAGPAVAKRLAPLIGGAVLVLLIVLMRRRRRTRR